MKRTRTTNDSRRGESDEHSCAFCGTKFDVSQRTTCPECEAELVMRGQR